MALMKRNVCENELHGDIHVLITLFFLVTYCYSKTENGIPVFHGVTVLVRYMYMQPIAFLDLEITTCKNKRQRRQENKNVTFM